MMAGPTTEVLNDDLRVLRDEVHGIDLDVREVSTKVSGVITSIKILGIFTLASLLSGVWWGASLTVKVDNVGTRLDKLEMRIEKLESKVDAMGARLDKLEANVEARFDKLDASIGKLIEQLKLSVKP